jgi:hypothetical protein
VTAHYVIIIIVFSYATRRSRFKFQRLATRFLYHDSIHELGCPIVVVVVVVVVVVILLLLLLIIIVIDRPCGPVVRVQGYRSRGLGSILGATRFYET